MVLVILVVFLSPRPDARENRVHIFCVVVENRSVSKTISSWRSFCKSFARLAPHVQRRNVAGKKVKRNGEETQSDCE